MANPAPELTTTRVSLDTLERWPGNARRGVVSGIKESMRVNGVFQPLIVQKSTNRIIAGNHRYDALKELHEEQPDEWDGHADVVYLDVNDSRALKMNIADNKTSDDATWDDRALLDQLQSIIEDGDDLLGTGFAPDEVDDLAAMIEDELDLPDGITDDGGDEDEDGGDKALPAASLIDRFGVPPLTVLDRRQGYWTRRSRAWRNAGVASKEGRDEGLIYVSPQAVYDNWYPVKEKAERAAGRTLTTDEVLAAPEASGLVAVGQGSGTSVFDPFLAEILYRWFSPDTGRVIDPWAGGSVRGIVASALGRSYCGIDLSEKQVEANREQEAAFSYPEAVSQSPEDYTPDLTPVEEVGERLWIKREDAWSRGGASGAKSRAMFTVCEEQQAEGLITAGASNSAQIERGALVAAALGIPARIHTGQAKHSPEIETSMNAGAEVLQHVPGRLTVIRKRLADDAEEHPTWAVFPFGMESETYVRQVAEQVANIPDDVERLVVPFGSGMTLSGVVRGVIEHGRALPILAVSVGTRQEDYLDRFAPEWRDYVTVVEHPSEYGDRKRGVTLGGVALDSIYEAKAAEYMEPGDCLWTVGVRSSDAAAPVVHERVAPEWIVGDSRIRLRDLPAESFDMAIGCPPYYDLEEYSEQEGDLSALSYEEFDAAMADTLKELGRVLKPGAFACFVVGSVRATKEKNKSRILDMRRCMTDAAATGGMWLYHDAVLLDPVGNAAMRSGRPFRQTRMLTRTHQEVLVYVKGDRREGVARLGSVEDTLALPEADEDAAGDGE